MKKRLLSAALALAMVLTLLPFSAMPALAADPPEYWGKTVSYYSQGATFPGAASGATIPSDGWYYIRPATTTDPATPVSVATGLINSTGTSGTWYSNVTDAMGYSATSVKLLGAVSEPAGGFQPIRSMTIDLNGKTWTTNGIAVYKTYTPAGGTATNNSCSKLTIQDTSTGTPGSFTGNITVSPSVSVGWGYNCEIELNNVTTTSTVTVNHAGSGKVTVNNATVGTIDLVGVPAATGGSTTGGSVTVTGSSAQTGKITVKAIAGGTETITGGTVSVSGGGKTGDIDVDQASGSNTVTVTGAGTTAGYITVDQTSGGSVTVSSGAVTGSVALNTTKGSGSNPFVNVTSGASAQNISAVGDSVEVNLTDGGRANGNVTIFGRYGSTLKAGEATSLIAPKVTLNGGFITGNIAKFNTASAEGLEKNYTIDIKGGSTVGGTINLLKADITADQTTVTGKVTLNSGTLTVNNNVTLTTGVDLGTTVADSTVGAEAVMNVVGLTNNTFGAITEVTGNVKPIVLTIPGAVGAGQNPMDNDTNKFASVTLEAAGTSKCDTNRSSIKGGHYQAALKEHALDLLWSDLAYLVTESSGTYKYSYWMDNVSLMNKLAALSGDGKIDKTIVAKGAITASSGLGDNAGLPYVSLYMYDPRTVGNSNPADSPAKPSDKANLQMSIRISGAGDTSITLPSAVGSNKSITWYPLSQVTDGGGTHAPYESPITPVIDTTGTSTAGGIPITPSASIAYVSNDVSYKVTKVQNVQVVPGTNSTVKATLSGGNIVLSGLAQIAISGNTAVIPLVLETDAIEKVYINATWTPSTAALTFSDVSPNLKTQTGGAMEITQDGKIRIVESNTVIGLTQSGLTKFDLVIDIQGNGDGTNGTTGGLVTITSKIPDSQVSGAALKQKLAEALTVGAGDTTSSAAPDMDRGPVDFSQSPTVQQEFGAYIAKLNQTTLNNLLKKAQQDKYKEIVKPNATQTELNNLTDNQLKQTGYTTIAVVLYMQMDITSFNPGSSPYTMTATLTPYARVEAQSSNYAWNDATKKYAPVVIVNGTALGTLDSGNAGQVEVTLPDVSAVFNKGANSMNPATYAHQNATYVADVAAKAFTLQNTADKGAGFGTIVLNETKPLAEVLKQKAADDWEPYSPKKLYDTVQAAVDDARNGEKIVVSDSSSSIVEYPINVTGRARTFYIDVNGNQKITRASSASGVTITQPTGNSTQYTVQLTKDNYNTVVKPTEKPISVVYTPVTGGSVALSASRADEGDTITVTLTPAAGYRSNGITVRTDKGTTVTVSGSGNQYTFVVPKDQDIKSVTVTPSFVKTTATGILVTVSGTSYGTATTSAGSNRVAAGSAVSVTVSPSTGYRTMGLYVTSDTGSSATATRTGANTFTFTVPSATNSVVVTPRFDRNNGTLFEDVWSTDYFSSAVGWAVGRGITNGDGSVYRFGTGKSCTREDMVTFLWRNAGSPIVTGVSNPFWDVQVGSYYYNAVMWAVKNGITKGVSANQFGVGRAVTRGEAVTFLYRAAGEPAASTNSGFYDVPSGEYYAKAVSWAVGKGITNGDGSTVKFSPNGYCLREQIVTFMYRNATGTRA